MNTVNVLRLTKFYGDKLALNGVNFSACDGDFIGLLGANYVAITPGGHDQVLKDGEVIKTKESADLSTAIAQFGSITERVDRFLADLEGGTIGGEGGLFGEVNGFFNENKDKFVYPSI